MRRSTLVSAVIILSVLGGAGIGVYEISKALLPHKRSAPASLDYLPGRRFIRALSVGFDSAVADILWIRSIQYFNEETLKPRPPGGKKGALLGPMFQSITDLDPHFHGAYWYGSLFLRIFHRFEEALDLLEKGKRHNPGVFFYPFELGSTCYHDLRDRPVPPSRKRPGVETYRDLAITYYEEALRTGQPSHRFVRMFRAILSGRGEHERILELFEERRAEAKTEALKRYWEEKIRLELSRWLRDRVQSAAEAFRSRNGRPPHPEELASLDETSALGMRTLASLPTYALLAVQPLRYGGVENHEDFLLYDEARLDIRSLFLVRDRDRQSRRTIEAAVVRYFREHARTPPPGRAGIRRLIDKRYLRRDFMHPLGGMYVLDGEGRPVSEKGWEKALREAGIPPAREEDAG